MTPTNPFELKHAVAVGLLLESCEVNEALRLAMTAAAKLLQDCKCQNARRQEALAAVGMADAAIDRLHRLNAAIVRLLPDTPGVVQ